ncbi:MULTISPECIES: hydroxyacid dehydrogenase [Arthrobacter]|uniref:Hydroxyacid dehydrogenase n=1 Tax=Arthrobacter terricola TaxID=2547396 RepID=A0A4R5KDA7_9MICC|nr:MULTISPECIES: hydroxyacid dehydrogenase [Arthrobacter]MBT8162421.1 hydroxyacid dehydrogenase [Arthrobacter sp. GN70]TDF93329.1 hydroxyacid dehydrogenase [Arthrobacter terricola]
MRPLATALAMAEDTARGVFPPSRLATISGELELIDPRPLTSFDGERAARVLAETEILITGWGCPPLTREVLERAPRLRFALHAAGSVKEHITEAVWERGIEVSTAADANAIPVAEYTVAMILLANKGVLRISRELHHTQGPIGLAQYPGIGNYGKRVGIVGASRIGRRVAETLAGQDLEVVLCDPYVTDHQAARLGVRLVDLDELVATSDVVSLHAPDLPETRHLIDARLLELFKPGATFINTARGGLVDQDALVRRLQRGDLFAVLDVTTPWVLDPGHPLYSMQNVFLTPHMAGSQGTELERLAAAAIEEARRAARGEPLRHPVAAAALNRLA